MEEEQRNLMGGTREEEVTASCNERTNESGRYKTHLQTVPTITGKERAVHATESRGGRG